MSSEFVAAMRTLLMLLLFFSLTLPRAYAQGERKAVQFSGVIVGGKNSEILPGAYVFLPRAGRGTLSNNVGFFTLPVFPGDSILFSYTGYERQYFVIPRNYRDETFSAKIQLQEDAIMLREVKVYPFRSRKEFDDAFLAMTLADARQRQALAENTDAAALRRLGVIQGNTPSANFRTSQQQLLNYANNKGFANTLNLLNPFAWASFINSIKRGDLSNDEWKSNYKDMPSLNTNRDAYIRQQKRNN